jgi:hypothetical protein
VAIARYGLARAGLVAAIAALLSLSWVRVPLLVSIMVGLVVALPLSLMLLPKLRKDLDTALAAARRRRREQKARLRAQLRGEDLSGRSARPSQGEADSGAERPGEHDQPGGTEHRDEVATTDASEHPPNR